MDYQSATKGSKVRVTPIKGMDTYGLNDKIGRIDSVDQTGTGRPYAWIKFDDGTRKPVYLDALEKI